jgi:phosphoribosylformylglycinamidine cyclo-ligase
VTVKGESGADISLGNRCSAIAYAWAKKTFENRSEGDGRPVFGLDGAFSNVVKIGDAQLGLCSDGIGTKIELAERMGTYHTLGFDLVAMVVDDLAANGLEPVTISNILDVDFLDSGIIDELMRGLHDAAERAAIVVTGGEIAELGDRISGFGHRMHFNWCATAVGVIPGNKRPIDGTEIGEGDAVVALKSRGFRSNGFSLIRRIMHEAFGADWHTTPYGQGASWGQVLMEPSLIYSPGIVSLLRDDCPVKGIAHITGGGIPDNLARVLAAGHLGAKLDDLFPPLEMMKRVQILGGVDEQNAYRLWNMGNGMLIVVDQSCAQSVIDSLSTHAYVAKIAGTITDSPGIEIHTAGSLPTTLIVPVT